MTMFIQVRLFTGYQEPLWYTAPAKYASSIAIGSMVYVPLRTQVVPALVITTQTTAPKTSFELKEIDHLETVPHDTHFYAFIQQLTAYYQIDPIDCIKRLAQFLDQKEITESVSPSQFDPILKKIITLTDEQQTVSDFMRKQISAKEYTPILLHGVTGSGKTEVYKNSMLHCLSEGKSCLFLLPEVSMALAFEHRLRAELPEHIPLYSFHSASSAKQKKLLWRTLISGQPLIIIGVHLPLLLPIANLGCIIIDEEHEVGYQEKKHPKINTKEAALLRAKQYAIPILLGSATPSISSLYNVHKKSWHFFQLKKRFAGALPTIQTVLLSDKKERKNFWISNQLYAAIKDRLAKKEQTILFINRRGFSFFVQCKSCTFVFMCAHCSVSLTLHENNHLSCHYCGAHKQIPLICPSCKGPEKDFIKKGIGTQQVVSILERLFPSARIGRADLDSTSKKKEWHETVDAMTKGDIDILVGTQTITKGYHFPLVTLVGVLWADLNLHFPLYNAAETCLQQLIQVAGRAGRNHEKSDVIIQSMAEHHIFNYVTEIDYLSFYQYEISARQELGYPPCSRLAYIELKNTNETQLDKDAALIADTLMTVNRQLNGGAQILGPAQPPVAKIKNMYSRKIYIKCTSMHTIIRLYNAVDHARYASSIFFTPNPVT